MYDKDYGLKRSHATKILSCSYNGWSTDSAKSEIGHTQLRYSAARNSRFKGLAQTHTHNKFEIEFSSAFTAKSILIRDDVKKDMDFNKI